MIDGPNGPFSNYDETAETPNGAFPNYVEEQTETTTLNKFQATVATEDLGWDLEKAELIFGWADYNGMWADWSEWDSEQFVEHFTMVEQDFCTAFPNTPIAERYRAQKAQSRALHPTATKSC